VQWGEEAIRSGVLLIHDAPVVIEMMMHQKFFRGTIAPVGVGGSRRGGDRPLMDIFLIKTKSMSTGGAAIST